MFRNPENPGSRNSLTSQTRETSQRLSVVERLRTALKKNSVVPAPIFLRAGLARAYAHIITSPACTTTAAPPARWAAATATTSPSAATATAVSAPTNIRNAISAETVQAYSQAADPASTTSHRAAKAGAGT